MLNVDLQVIKTIEDGIKELPIEPGQLLFSESADKDTVSLYLDDTDGRKGVGLHIFGPVTVSVPVGSWAGTGPWTQTVSVAGVTAADNGLTVCPVDVADKAAREAYTKAYACLAVEAETVAGGIKLTCRDGKPEITFNIVVKGVR